VLLAHPPTFSIWVILGYVLLMVSAVLTLWSMCLYLKAAWPYMSMHSDQKSDK
jgi:CDP-diacylglycerol--glycerol-3-phosphate 3-phosphatidyltransferase